MSASRDVAIVVPTHRLDLSPAEKISLHHLDHFLPGYDRYLILPSSLSGTLPGFEPRHFPDRFFRSQTANQDLFVSRELYEAFAGYRYILIYQFDSLVFSDQLVEWCTTGIDYVGAPWIDCEWLQGQAHVGNGGFSLRRIEAFLDVLDSDRYWIDPDQYGFPQRLLKRWRLFNGVGWQTRNWVSSRTKRNEDVHEDAFWSFEAQRYLPEFRIATVEEALRFSFETSPRKCFEMTAGRLPFGCHAWETYDRDFWLPHLLAD